MIVQSLFKVCVLFHKNVNHFLFAGLKTENYNNKINCKMRVCGPRCYGSEYFSVKDSNNKITNIKKCYSMYMVF